jgi:hypothetical protein
VMRSDDPICDLRRVTAAFISIILVHYNHAQGPSQGDPQAAFRSAERCAIPWRWAMGDANTAYVGSATSFESACALRIGVQRLNLRGMPMASPALPPRVCQRQ